MLQLTNIKKCYHTDLILQIPSLIIEKGIYWVKGNNGSGKTTFLKMIAGLLPFEGNIRLESTALKTDRVAFLRKISWAEAEPLFPSFMSGRELINLYKNIRKASQQQTDALVELFAMTPYISSPVGTYSAGTIKKLSLILALIGDPLWVILDEPLITLDEEAFHTTCSLILDINRKSGTGFLMSSHQQPDTPLSFTGKEIIVSNKTATING